METNENNIDELNDYLIEQNDTLNKPLLYIRIRDDKNKNKFHDIINNTDNLRVKYRRLILTGDIDLKILDGNIFLLIGKEYCSGIPKKLRVESIKQIVELCEECFKQKVILLENINLDDFDKFEIF